MRMGLVQLAASAHGGLHAVAMTPARRRYRGWRTVVICIAIASIAMALGGCAANSGRYSSKSLAELRAATEQQASEILGSIPRRLVEEIDLVESSSQQTSSADYFVPSSPRYWGLTSTAILIPDPENTPEMVAPTVFDYLESQGWQRHEPPINDTELGYAVRYSRQDDDRQVWLLTVSFPRQDPPYEQGISLSISSPDTKKGLSRNESDYYDE